MKLTVVVPCKNQSQQLFDNIIKLGIPYFGSLGIDYEFLLVIDGSNEENIKIAEERMKEMPSNIRLAEYENKIGKGHNVKHGFLEAKGDYVMFMDADFATDLHVFDKILPEIDQYDGFIASRHCKGAVINRKQTFVRRFVSAMSRFLIINVNFHFPYKDTQCGYKVFRRELAQEMAKRQIIDGFAFDVEYLWFCKLNGFKVKEVPCVWTDGEVSTIKNARRVSMDFMKDMRLIKKNKKNYILNNEERQAFGLPSKEEK